MFVQKPFRFERRHASHTGSRNSLSIDVVSDVSGGKNAKNIGCCRVWCSDEITVPSHVQLALEQFRGWGMANSDKDPVDSLFGNITRFDLFQSNAGHAERVFVSQHLVQCMVPDDLDLGVFEQAVLKEFSPREDCPAGGPG